MKSSMQSLARCAGIALLVAFSTAASAAWTPVPKVLPVLPGDDGGIAFAINNKGEAAGVSLASHSFYDTTAVKWSRKGEPSALPPLPGDSNSWADDINIRGEVAGASFTGDAKLTTYTAVRWDRDGQPHALPPLPGDLGSFARGINKGGQVVGASVDADGNRTAVIWDRKGQVRALPGGTDAFAINNRGDVVGDLSMWTSDGTRRMLSLAIPDVVGGGYDCYYDEAVEAINRHGVMAGFVGAADAFCATVRWSRDGEPELLELPYLPTYPGEFDYFDAFGHDIESTGEVVGETSYGWGGLWDRSGDFIPLPTPEGGDNNGAYAINIRGEVVGYSESPGFVSGEWIHVPVVWR